MELTNVELLKNLLDIELSGENIDLHNDYTCTDVLYREKDLRLKFKKSADEGEFLMIQFIDTEISKLEFSFGSNDGITLDNFHRGRYEIEGRLFDEYNGKKCFYIEFYEGGTIELLCKQVILIHPRFPHQ
jgi:hypothetical protein